MRTLLLRLVITGVFILFLAGLVLMAFYRDQLSIDDSFAVFGILALAGVPLIWEFSHFVGERCSTTSS